MLTQKTLSLVRRKATLSMPFLLSQGQLRTTLCQTIESSACQALSAACAATSSLKKRKTTTLASPYCNRSKRAKPQAGHTRKVRSASIARMPRKTAFRIRSRHTFLNSSSSTALICNLSVPLLVCPAHCEQTPSRKRAATFTPSASSSLEMRIFLLTRAASASSSERTAFQRRIAGRHEMRVYPKDFRQSKKTHPHRNPRKKILHPQKAS